MGGGGFDAADYTLSDTGVTVSLGNGTATGEGQDRLTGIEDVWGSTHADRLTGNASPNHLYGWDGADVLDGRGGDDLLVPGIGNDTVEGGVGADYVDYFYGKLSNFLAANPVNVNLAEAVATGSGTDSLSRIENISGTNRNDVLVGNGGANAIMVTRGRRRSSHQLLARCCLSGPLLPRTPREFAARHQSAEPDDFEQLTVIADDDLCFQEVRLVVVDSLESSRVHTHVMGAHDVGAF